MKVLITYIYAYIYIHIYIIHHIRPEKVYKNPTSKKYEEEEAVANERKMQKERKWETK